MFVFTILFLLLTWVAIFRFRRRRMYELASKIPSSGYELPFIGVAHTLFGDTENIMTRMKNYCYISMKNKGLISAWLGPKLYFVMVHPEDLEYLLKTSLEKDELHRFMRNIFGNGGIYAPVPIWRRRRKILVPAFSPKIVENFVKVFSEQSEKLAERLIEKIDKGVFSIWPFLSTCTLDSVCQSAMGVKIRAQDNPDSPFLVSLNRILNLITERIFHLWLQPDWLYKMLPQYPIHESCISVLHTFTDSVISKKREELKMIEEDGENQTKPEFLSGYNSETSFLELLIKLSGGDKGYTDMELREEVLTLAVAGTDTSAVAIGFTLKMFAKYPEVQDKVYQELYDVFGNSRRPLVKGDLPHLKYLERVVKETLRLFPPVPFIIRTVTKDTTLPSGRQLPAGSGVVVSIWGVHRDPKYWGPDAETFDPDRFLPERFNIKHPCSYMPFSHGPRNCLGYQYALMSIKTAIAAIIRRFIVLPDPDSPTPDLRVKLDVMMKAVDGYQVALKRRQPMIS